MRAGRFCVLAAALVAAAVVSDAASAATIARSDLVPFRAATKFRMSCTWGNVNPGACRVNGAVYHPYPALDIQLPANTDVTAAGAGQVTFASSSVDASFGYFVLVYHEGDNRTSMYAHLSAPPPVRKGQRVLAGQLLGKSGNTGASEGAHLHYAEAIGRVATAIWANGVSPGGMIGGSGTQKVVYPNAWGFTDWRRANKEPAANTYTLGRGRLAIAPGDWAGHIVQWDGDRKAQKTAWLVGGDFRRRWIDTTARYSCLKRKKVPGPVALPAATLNDLRDVTGVKAPC